MSAVVAEGVSGLESPRFIRANDLQFAYLEAGEGPLVICLHGFPDTAWSFRPLLAELAAAGFRAVAPFLRGYGPTDLAPDDDYSLLALGRDVIALMEHFAVPTASLVGHDWGAAIAYAAATMRPDRISRFAAAAVPHPRRYLLRPSWDQLRASSYMLKFQFPGWADRRIPANNYEWLRAMIQRWSPRWRFGEPELALLKAAIGEPRRLRAALRYYRAIPWALLHAEAWSTLLQPVRVPVLQIYGTEDGCILPKTFAGSEHLHAARYELAGIERAGHFMHIEAADEFAAQVIRFLKSS